MATFLTLILVTDSCDKPYTIIPYHFFAELLFTFNNNMYNVNEGDGLVDNLIFVEKQDGRASEQILSVDVSLQFISARGTTTPLHTYRV